MNINYKFRKSDPYSFPDSERNLSILAILYVFFFLIIGTFYIHIDYINLKQINNVHQYMCIYVSVCSLYKSEDLR